MQDGIDNGIIRCEQIHFGTFICFLTFILMCSNAVCDFDFVFARGSKKQAMLCVGGFLPVQECSNILNWLDVTRPKQKKPANLTGLQKTLILAEILQDKLTLHQLLASRITHLTMYL